MSIQLQPADIFLTRGTSFLSKAIRVCTRTIGEKRTKYNHTGLVVTQGDVKTAEIVEALITVQRHTLWSHYQPPSKDMISIYRPLGLSPQEIQRIVDSGNSYVGRKYGTLKLVAHFLDWLLLGAYVFRRLARMDDYPICSWVVAYAYDKIGLAFNGPPNAASPDDIGDYIEAHPEKFELVYPFSHLTDIPQPK